jgi:hypothetical protein
LQFHGSGSRGQVLARYRAPVHGLELADQHLDALTLRQAHFALDAGDPLNDAGVAEQSVTGVPRRFGQIAGGFGRGGGVGTIGKMTAEPFLSMGQAPHVSS